MQNQPSETWLPAIEAAESANHAKPPVHHGDRKAADAPASSEQMQQAHLWVGLKDWVLHALTGVWATDLSLASTTGLLNLQSLTWDTGVLRLAGVQADQLPPLVSPTAVVGGLTAEVAAATGLPAGLPVIAGGSDGAMAGLLSVPAGGSRYPANARSVAGRLHFLRLEEPCACS